jgi:hypothetical protein
MGKGLKTQFREEINMYMKMLTLSEGEKTEKNVASPLTHIRLVKLKI